MVVHCPAVANRLMTWPEFEAEHLDVLSKHRAANPEPPAAPLETRHLFRPQRRLLIEAMDEAREFDGTRAGLQALLSPGDVLHDVTPYGGIDKRIGWDTYIVTTTHPGWADPRPSVAGFINGPLID